MQPQDLIEKTIGYIISERIFERNGSPNFFCGRKISHWTPALKPLTMTRFLERLSSMKTPPIFNKTNHARDFSKIFAGTSYFFEKPIITTTELSYTITSNLQPESFTALCKSSAVKSGLSRGLGTLILLFLIFFFTVLTSIVFMVVDNKTKSSASIYILLFIPVGFIYSFLLTRKMGADLVPAKTTKTV